MSTERTMLQRTIVYEGHRKCSVCGKTHLIVRKDYIEAEDPAHVIYGPGDDNYGRDRLLVPPPPIPQPNALTEIHCEHCQAKWGPEKINGLPVVSDSAKERYEAEIREENKRNQAIFDAFGPPAGFPI